MPVSVRSAAAQAPPPVFARQAAPTPYGFSQNGPSRHAGPPYGYSDLAAPPPPHSLTPVAMASDRTRTGQGPASEPRRAPSTFSSREKPSLKWGVMIALSGALLGGVLGLGMDARRQRDHASASAQLPEAARVTVPAQGGVNGLAATSAPAIPPPQLGGPVAPPVVARASVVVAPPAPVVVAPPKNEAPAKAERHARAAPVPAKHPSFVAAKVSAPKPPPAPEKPEPAPKLEKEPVKSGSSDARKVLEDAIKDTTNTL